MATGQLICVEAEGAGVVIRCYDKANGVWRFKEDLGIIAGHAGRNGISKSKREGDGCTPAGLFRLGHAFGVREKPETRLAYRRITGESFWVDDPVSRLYNRWVEGRDGADWQSAERLSDYPREYAYAVVIEYNTYDTIPGKGSAVFLHCGERPTSGCIAIPEPDLLKILLWLDPEKSPGILISE